MSGLPLQPLGSKRVWANFSQNRSQRNAVLQRDRDGQREAVHQAADRRSFFRHGDEEFAGLAVGIEADGDVALVVSDFELVRDRGALFLQLVAHGARRSVHVLFFDVLRGGDAGVVLGGVRRLGAGGARAAGDFLQPSR